MDPEHALDLYRHLSMANKKVIAGDDLHIVYQITPSPCHVNPPWHSYIDYTNYIELPLYRIKIKMHPQTITVQ